MIDSNRIKNLAKQFGSDLCGVASVDKFENAPRGFHPKDVFEDTKSLIALACRVPESALFAKTSIPYSAMSDVIMTKVHSIAISLVLELESLGYRAVMIPSVPYDYWDAENTEGRGILSLKHIGYYAGLGYIGKNTLLCNREYGNLIKLGAVITNAVLKPDEVYEGQMCNESCNLCVKSCPVEAIENYKVDQKKCRLHSEVLNGRGIEITVCMNCRKACPNRAGIQNKLFD